MGKALRKVVAYLLFFSALVYLFGPYIAWVMLVGWLVSLFVHLSWLKTMIEVVLFVLGVVMWATFVFGYPFSKQFANRIKNWYEKKFAGALVRVSKSEA